MIIIIAHTCTSKLATIDSEMFVFGGGDKGLIGVGGGRLAVRQSARLIFHQREWWPIIRNGFPGDQDSAVFQFFPDRADPVPIDRTVAYRTYRLSSTPSVIALVSGGITRLIDSRSYTVV